MSQPILVIGSTGKTGRRIVDRLRTRGFRVRGGSRQSETPFDWQQPDTWTNALRGVETVYISFHPDLAMPGAPETIQALTDKAKRAGVQRLVLLSGRGEANAQRCEQIVATSGLGYTLIRAAWFAQNFTEGALRDAVLGGVVAMPAGQSKEPFVDVDDIADVAVAALTEDRHGQLYDVTGPRLMTFADAAAEMTRAAGRNIQYAPISLEDFHAAMTKELGPEYADVLTGICREVFDGRNEHLGDGVQRALGRAPRDFADFCRTAAVSGVWNVPVGSQV